MKVFVRALLLLLISTGFSSAQDLRVDFRKKVNEDLLRFDGPDHFDYVKLEDQGLRWRYGGGKSPTKPVGVRWDNRIKGDFNVTAQYEILNVDRPERGNGVGIEIYVMLATPAPRDAIAYARLMHPASGPIFALNYMTNNEQGRRFSKDPVHKPTTTRSKEGKLRLARAGTKLMAYAAEGDGEFFLINEVPREIGDVDVLMVRIAALDGGDVNAELDMRLLEVTINAKFASGGGVALGPPPAPTDVLSDRGSGRWVFWVLAIVAVLGVGIFAAIFGIFWLVRPRAKPVAAKAPAKKPAATPEKAQQASLMIEMQCASCGKRLKVKDTSAGKLVKCPECGQSTRVPGK